VSWKVSAEEELEQNIKMKSNKLVSLYLSKTCYGIRYDSTEIYEIRVQLI